MVGNPPLLFSDVYFRMRINTGVGGTGHFDGLPTTTRPSGLFFGPWAECARNDMDPGSQRLAGRVAL
jgi:hypothetical protein